MKAHGIHPLNPSVRDVPVAPKNKDPDKMTALKKRKLDQFSVPASAATDDDEGLAKIKNEVEKVVIKDEPTGFGRRYSTAEILQYPTPQGELTGVGYSNTYRSDDGNAFNDFIHSGAFGHGLPEPDDFQVGRIPPIYGNMMAAPQPHESQPAPNEIILITD